MAIELEMSSDRKLLQVLSGLNEENARKACIVAGKRAATAARAAGSRQIRSIYTMKAADVKAKARIKGTGDGAVIEIRGTTEPVEKYKAQGEALLSGQSSLRVSDVSASRSKGSTALLSHSSTGILTS